MIWMNGQILDSASISVRDHGFTVGDGVFETLKTINGQPFALTRHLERLRASAAGMALPLPDAGLVTQAISELMKSATYDIGRLRITWTSGSGGAGSLRASNMSPTLVLTHDQASTWPSEAKVATVAWPRNERSPLMQLKTISYAENVLALAQAHQVGAEEAIFFNLAGNLSEGTGSNVLVRHMGTWITPPLSAGVLAGVTRALAIQWLGVEEADLSREEFLNSTEVILSSSTRDLQAVGSVDGKPIAGLRSAEVSKLIEQFARLATQEINP